MGTESRFILGVLATFGALACTSTGPSVQETVAKVKEVAERQEADAETLVRALASAQRDAANASWKLIVDATAQNRRKSDMASDSEASVSDRDEIESESRKKLATLLDHVSQMETQLLEDVKADYELRARLLELLAHDVQSADVVDHVNRTLDTLKKHRVDVDRIDDSFKNAVKNQIGYFGY